ncbi:antitoxin of type II TA system, VapB [Streptomyces sp. cf386]|uniref:type II toxin-antitoxin system VapB family antitoxin n=1 Tax=Streptomyces sp. cf386 TaxID=1761904 RepID=UPI00088190E8|nr:type II toxin-antitoxin system VapB family antitoxin [Streptomyces sp. cf386]SDO36467.1 antitoxin of type II TA system, VapB [Streptomyces sp. cf386]
MTVTKIDLDDEALAEAMRLKGSTAKKEAVNAALRDYVACIKRPAEDLAARGALGEFDAAAVAHEAARRARRAAFE